ncbi:Ribosomal protein L11 methyltransferase [bioreactor metagenome]|uniref:Ribosomal protein L11 methyltransferase n=1 Tax=bioreactor metagenome TaxID=1076179 RepID=A0A645FM20_9ZZZZ
MVSDNAQIDAVDIDPVAVKICKENFIQNHIKSDRYRIFCGDATEDDASAIKLSEKYDLIFANIVAGVIIELGSFFANKLNKKGKLIASGIITERMNEVVEAMKAYGFEKEDGLSLEGWECIVFSL